MGLQERCCVVALVLMMLGALAGAEPEETVWYPASEPSPFIPDDAQWIASGGGRTTHFRGTWTVHGPVKRAVLVVAPSQTVRAYVNGRLVAEAYDSHQATPVWVDVTEDAQSGRVFVAARAYSEWGPALYAQMRVEYVDGTWADFGTGPDWQWADAPGEDWARDPTAPGEWTPVRVSGTYRIEGGAFWGREFALLPRKLLQARFQRHNAHLRELWETDRTRPGLRLTQPPERPQWAEAFRDFWRVDEATGQLVDGAGRVRHLFFTIYDQPSGLGVTDWDLDRLEADLDLMARADVHLYVRMLGWGSLLTADGEWAELKQQPRGAHGLHFPRGIDLLDHFVRRAWAHGRCVIFEGDFFWSAHSIVAPPYRSRYHLYPEVLEAQALATRRIMHRYANCPNVLGIMIGEEDIVLDHDLSNPHQRALFADFLQRKYGSLEAFKRQTPWGYDYADRSGYLRRWLTPDHWPGAAPEEVLVPRFTARQGVFEGMTDWAQIPLPLWPQHMSPERPEVALCSFRSYNQFTPEDPLWIDFYEMREDQLLFGMLCRWAEIVREAMPRQLLFYSNAQDFTDSWHFLHLYRRADLPFDVIGVGCHDADQNLSELPAWATVRKAIKITSSYRPYVLAPGSPARGVASGEGQGGRPGDEQAILDYYRGALFDEIGGGNAWTQTYTWRHISGATGDQPPHLTPFLQWMGEFMPAVQGVAFPLRRPVQVLVVRNTNLAHSNMSGLDYGNVLAVAEALTQLNVEFDIVMDRDLTYAGGGSVAPYKLDLTPYRLVILPSVTLDYPEPVWRALDEWLYDPAYAGERVLVVGQIGNRGPRLQPTAGFHPTLQKWLGSGNYLRTVALQGKQSLELEGPDGREHLEVDFGHVPPTGVLHGGQPVLRTAEGAVIGARFAYGGDAVHAFGFPLGLAHDPLWGMAPEQSPRDAMAPVYEMLAEAAGVDRPILAPHNLRVYVAAGGQMLLIRERAGLETSAEVAVRVPPGTEYEGLPVREDPDGYVRFHVALRPWEGRWWKRR